MLNNAENQVAVAEQACQLASQAEEAHLAQADRMVQIKVPESTKVITASH